MDETFLPIGVQIDGLRQAAVQYTSLPTPTVDNTGPRVPVEGGVHTTLYTTQNDGEVISGQTFLDGIRIVHDNVVVSDNIFTGTGAIKVANTASRTLIEYNIIHGAAISTGISSGDTGQTTIRFNEIYEVGSDGWRVGRYSEVFAGNYLHTLGLDPGSHADGIQFYYNDPLTATGILIANNRIVLDGPRANASIFMGARTDHVLVIGNEFRFGGYLATRSEFNAADDTVVYENNGLADWRFGPHSEDLGWNATTWKGNIDLSTGASLDLPPIWENDFNFEQTPHSFSFYFDRDYGEEVELRDFTLESSTFNYSIPSTDFTMVYDPRLLSVTYTYKYGLIPNGRYYARMNLTNTVPFEKSDNEDDESEFLMHFIQGDADRDRNVDFDDLLIMARKFNTTPTSTPRYEEGDFDYDGNVDFDDLLILARNYNKSAGTIPPPAAPAVASIDPPAKRTRKTPITI